MSEKPNNTTTRWVNYPGTKIFSRVSIHIGGNELQFIHVLGEHKGEIYQIQIDHEELSSIKLITLKTYVLFLYKYNKP